MPAWDKTLFPIQATSYKFSNDVISNIINEYGGLPRIYKNRSAPMLTIECEVFVADADYFAWRQFYEVDLDNGSLEFDVDLDIGNGLETITCSIASDSITQTNTKFNIYRLKIKLLHLLDVGASVDDAQFPTDIPILINGYKLKYPNLNINPGIQAGIPTTANQIKNNSVEIDFTLLLRSTTRTTFYNFYTSQINNGLASFNINLDLGAGPASQAASLIAPISMNTSDGINWQCKLKVLVERFVVEDGYCGNLTPFLSCFRTCQAVDDMFESLSTLCNDNFNEYLAEADYQ